ncbi:AlbA family DNA-binding domain-containing protein [Leifsonia sp. P73]|uniref:AlbA family DNA-binding domain-containing protein n=1 Tax=Leifsonia sp. P73 TaxID=3423959 RepID=UPI003DA60C86
MTFNLDTSRALRTHAQLVDLIQAVVSAAPEDESRAVEWKSGYSDLGSSEASFALARAILGMANRSVSVSAATFEGVGYVVVGAEPGGIEGQAIPDSAELLHAIRRYTGHGWPLWDPRSVDVEGVSVLVITVEPPRDGDRIALLQKGYQPSRGPLVPEGAIFVRQPGSTERASRADLELLQDRLLAAVSSQEAAVRADRIERARQLVGGAVSAAHRWADSIQILTIMSAGDRWKSGDWMEYVNTDSGRQMAEDMQTMKDSARQLRLLVSDPELLAPLAVAMQEQSNGEAFSGLHKSPVTGEARSVAYAHINRVKRAWDSVEEAAVRALAE